MKIKCINCGYEKEILESDFVGDDDCVLCGRQMHSSDYTDYINKQNQEQEHHYSNQEGISDSIFEQLVILMIQDIEEKGEEQVWQMLNRQKFQDKVLLMEIFFEAKRRMK